VKRSQILIGALLLALLAKFLAPLFLYDVPLGYDPGMYRYLFLTYAESFRSFSMPELLPWAKEYPPGLFFILSPFVAVGFPVDAVIGWVWNIFAVILAATLAWVTAQRKGKIAGSLVLLMALLSVAYYDGFVGMYYKAFAALFFTVLTYHLMQNRSSWFLLTAFLTVITHQQTGLILALALTIWWTLQLRYYWKDPWYRRITLLASLIALVAVVIYLPQWERAIWSPLKSIFLLRGENAPAGAFPDAMFYLRTTGVLLLLGVVGFIRSFKHERGSLWQLSVIVCAVFILLRLVFYKRFFLQLDFFLMPFAASTVVWLWFNFKHIGVRTLIVLLLGAQTFVSFQAMQLRVPEIQQRHLTAIQQVSTTIPEEASVIVLENISGPWLRGWRLSGQVGAPGLFDYPGWTYSDWELFIDGTNADRKTLLSGLEGDVYFLVTPTFTGFYGERAKKIFDDPCLSRVENEPLLVSVCS
tara:strand:+ start:887 stop:2296 length:1410 start_codon:yes stop_codon:yes gene_type:complete